MYVVDKMKATLLGGGAFLSKPHITTCIRLQQHTNGVATRTSDSNPPRTKAFKAIPLHYTILHYTTLHSTTLDYTTLYYTRLD